MFTGIIKAVGSIVARERRADGLRLVVDADGLPLDAVAPGDSIAVNGVCLTVVALGDGRFDADVSATTLEATTLGTLADGAPLNLEPALTLSAPLGGHLVSGHVDSVGRLKESDGPRMRFAMPPGLARYVVHKCSVCVDGVSLTVNAVDGDDFEVNVVPHTLAHTTLGALRAGDPVNIEVDLVARYLERLL